MRDSISVCCVMTVSPSSFFRALNLCCDAAEEGNCEASAKTDLGVVIPLCAVKPRLEAVEGVVGPNSLCARALVAVLVLGLGMYARLIRLLLITEFLRETIVGVEGGPRAPYEESVEDVEFEEEGIDAILAAAPTPPPFKRLSRLGTPTALLLLMRPAEEVGLLATVVRLDRGVEAGVLMGDPEVVDEIEVVALCCGVFEGSEGPVVALSGFLTPSILSFGGGAGGSDDDAAAADVDGNDSTPTEDGAFTDATIAFAADFDDDSRFAPDPNGVEEGSGPDLSSDFDVFVDASFGVDVSEGGAMPISSRFSASTVLTTFSLTSFSSSSKRFNSVLVVATSAPTSPPISLVVFANKESRDPYSSDCGERITGSMLDACWFILVGDMTLEGKKGAEVEK